MLCAVSLAVWAHGIELPLTRRLGASAPPVAPGGSSGFDHRGLVNVKADGGIQYVCDVRFGTPPQTLSLIIDTGSSDVLVPGESYKCAASSKSKHCGMHHLYRQSLSTTYKADSTGAPLALHEKYQAGFVDGVAADDRVEWGGYFVSWAHFGVLKSESKAIEFARADGIIGMAFDGLSKVTRPPLFAQMVQEWGDTLPNLFSLYIAPGLSPAGSKLILGGYDLALAGRQAVWHYTPVIKLKGYSEYTYWAMALTSMSLKWGDGLSMSVCRKKSGCQAIVDSGMWGVGVPRRYFARFVDMVTDNHADCKFVGGGDQVYCSRCYLDKFPTLYFGTPPDNTFAIRAGDYVMDAKGHNAQRGYTHVSGDECWLMFTQADKAGQQEVFVLGDTFLSTYYTLFDAGNMRIGLACDQHDTCLGGKHSEAVRGNVREGLAHSRVHQARGVGAMFAFSAFCFYIFWCVVLADCLAAASCTFANAGLAFRSAALPVPARIAVLATGSARSVARESLTSRASHLGPAVGAGMVVPEAEAGTSRWRMRGLSWRQLSVAEAGTASLAAMETPSSTIKVLPASRSITTTTTNRRNSSGSGDAYATRNNLIKHNVLCSE